MHKTKEHFKYWKKSRYKKGVEEMHFIVVLSICMKKNSPSLGGVSRILYEFIFCYILHSVLTIFVIGAVVRVCTFMRQRIMFISFK